MANQWFRFYAEWATDPKVQRMPEAMQRRLVMLLCARCDSGDVPVTFCDDDIAFHWRISDIELAATKALFIEKGFIDEQWNVLNWNKRQFISDSSTERTRQYRERMRTSQERHSDGEVTKCDALDTDTDTDTEVKPIVRSAHLAEEIYALYPRKVGRQAAIKAIEKAMRAIKKTRVCSLEEAATVLIHTVKQYAQSPAGNRKEYTPHCSTWMNEGRWNDDPAEWALADTSKPNGRVSDFQPAKKLNPAIYREGL